MPLIELPIVITIILDSFLWLAFHLLGAKIATLIPNHYFEKPLPNTIQNKRFQMFILERIFFVKYFKKYLPDGGALFKGGFEKKHLKEKNITYYKDFLRETRRAEWTHYIQMLPAPIFFLFNPIWVGYVMILYAILANMPCILTQKYNQIRFTNLIIRLEKTRDIK
jgi:glycosyl-4,4'-diaponeurosporenoate acyltransferase